METQIEKKLINLSKALKKLNEYLDNPSDVEINRVASIKAFEYTYELLIKLLGSLVQVDGESSLVIGSRNIIRAAQQKGLIQNSEGLIKYVESRNLTVHTYQESVVDQIYTQLPEFAKLVTEIITHINTIYAK